MVSKTKEVAKKRSKKLYELGVRKLKKLHKEHNEATVPIKHKVGKAILFVSKENYESPTKTIRRLIRKIPKKMRWKTREYQRCVQFASMVPDLDPFLKIHQKASWHWIVNEFLPGDPKRTKKTARKKPTYKCAYCGRSGTVLRIQLCSKCRWKFLRIMRLLERDIKTANSVLRILLGWNNSRVLEFVKSWNKKHPEETTKPTILEDHEEE